MDRLVWGSRRAWERRWDKNDYHRSSQVRQGKIDKVEPGNTEKKINKQGWDYTW